MEGGWADCRVVAEWGVGRGNHGPNVAGGFVCWAYRSDPALKGEASASIPSLRSPFGLAPPLPVRQECWLLSLIVSGDRKG
jgi:hypothetical protein